MSRVIDAAANRIAPWRGAPWWVLVAEGIVLAVAGLYLFVDGERAESILGFVVGAVLLVDGVRLWIGPVRRLERGRTRDLTLVRGAVGIIAGGLVVVLTLVGQITVVGVRIAIGVGALVYGVIGLFLAGPAIRRREANWTGMAYDVLLVALAALLLFRAATGDTIESLLALTAGLVIASGVAIGLLGIIRRARSQSKTGAPSDG